MNQQTETILKTNSSFKYSIKQTETWWFAVFLCIKSLYSEYVWVFGCWSNNSGEHLSLFSDHLWTVQSIGRFNGYWKYLIAAALTSTLKSCPGAYCDKSSDVKMWALVTINVSKPSHQNTAKMHWRTWYWKCDSKIFISKCIGLFNGRCTLIKIAMNAPG